MRAAGARISATGVEIPSRPFAWFLWLTWMLTPWPHYARTHTPAHIPNPFPPNIGSVWCGMQTASIAYCSFWQKLHFVGLTHVFTILWQQSSILWLHFLHCWLEVVQSFQHWKRMEVEIVCDQVSMNNQTAAVGRHENCAGIAWSDIFTFGTVRKFNGKDC